MSTQEEKQQKEKDQISRLKSGNTSAIIATIKEIRNSGNVAVLPYIFDLLANEPEEAVYTQVVSFLNDLKDKEAVPYLVSAIRDPENKDILKELVGACWQNNLDYHESLDLFIKLILTDSYEVSIEAFTVIENSIGSISDSSRSKYLNTIQKGLPGVEAEKQPLIRELIRMIEQF